MHLHRGVSALAAVLTLAATAPSAAYGFERASNGTPAGPSTTVIQRHSSDSTDWLIAIGAAGGITVIGGGMLVKHRHTHGRKHARAVSPS